MFALVVQRIQFWRVNPFGVLMIIDLPSLKEIDFGDYGLSCSRAKGQTSLVIRSMNELMC